MRDRPLAADDVAVVFIDLQENIINVGLTNDPRRARTAVAALADLANALGLPVVVSCVATTSGTVAPLLAEITARLPGALPFVRRTADAMDDPPFRAALAASSRRTIVLAGVVTEVAVRLAALAFGRHGLHPIIAVDACRGLDPRTESATFTHLSAAGVELSSVATIAAQLAGDFDSEAGRAAMRALQSTLSPHGHEHS
jgi:nicotinamidase-related amidase